MPIIVKSNLSKQLTHFLKSKLLKDELVVLPTETVYGLAGLGTNIKACLLYTSPSPRDSYGSRMPSSA